MHYFSKSELRKGKVKGKIETFDWKGKRGFQFSGSEGDFLLDTTNTRLLLHLLEYQIEKKSTKRSSSGSKSAFHYSFFKSWTMTSSSRMNLQIEQKERGLSGKTKKVFSSKRGLILEILDLHDMLASTTSRLQNWREFDRRCQYDWNVLSLFSWNTLVKRMSLQRRYIEREKGMRIRCFNRKEEGRRRHHVHPWTRRLELLVPISLFDVMLPLLCYSTADQDCLVQVSWRITCMSVFANGTEITKTWVQEKQELLLFTKINNKRVKRHSILFLLQHPSTETRICRKEIHIKSRRIWYPDWRRRRSSCFLR